jgi:glycosyltransferase involved in cell wall biosynthesis
MKVSICIPTLCNTQNRLETLKECIESCLGQTYNDIEVIVVDNASEIDLKSSLGTLKDPRLKIYRNDTTVPMTANFNKSLSYAAGEILKPMCDDDIIHPDFIKTTVEYASEHFVYVASQKFFVLDEINLDIRSLDDASHIKFEKKGFNLQKLAGRGIFPSATIFPAKLYTSVGGYDEKSGHFDHEFWVMSTLEFDSIYYEQKLCFFRDWKESYTSRTRLNPMPNYLTSCYTIRKLFNYPLLSSRNKLELKNKVLNNIIRGSLVLIKRLVLTPSKVMVTEYLDFVKKSIEMLFI